jgi:hypothetical protein
MSSIVNNITISGFKAFGSDCDGSDFINTTISSSSIYKYQAAAIAGSLSQTIYLDGATAGTRGGARTVDTLSVMVDTTDNTDIVEINGYSATRGVGSGGATAGGYVINWAVWASQSTGSGTTPSSTAYGNSPAYTVVAGSGTSYSLSQVLLSGVYNTNQSLSVSEGSNNLVIEIWNAARTTKKATLTYYVQIVSSSTRLASLIPNLSVGGYSYSPVFNSNYCAYNSQIYVLNVNSAATTMTLTPNTTILADTNSIIRITTPAGLVLAPLLSGSTSSSFNIADNNSVNVSVTAPDGTTVQQYVLSIQSDVSGNNLSSAVFSYYSTPSITTSFDASTAGWLNLINPTTTNLASNVNFSYINTIPNVSYGLSVTLSAVDSGSSVAVGTSTPVVSSGTFLIPYSSLVQGAQNVIVCTCISPTAGTKIYNFNIWLAGSDVSPSTAGKLSNITFNTSTAIIDPSNPFTSSNICQSASLNFTTTSVSTQPGANPIPTYTVYLTPSSSGATAVSIILNYNDNGSRFSTSIDNGSNWVPVGPLNNNISTDNWTQGSQRTTSVSITIPTPFTGTPIPVLVASHLPGSSGSTAYYGYVLNFVTPLSPGSLSGLNLVSYETNSAIILNPVFNPLVLSYTAYIGTAINPTNKVNLTALFGSGVVVDWSIVSGISPPAYVSGTQNLVSGTSTTINLGAIATSYVLYIRLWNSSSTTVEYSYYTLNLLNVDQSLVLSGLSVYNQNAPVSGVFPNPLTPSVTLSPTFSPTRFVYNAPITTLFATIQPTVLNSGVKTIRVSVAGSPPVTVVSGAYFRFPMNARNIAVQITISDNLSVVNSNSYTLFVYSNSSDVDLSLASFSGILNTSFSPALPTLLSSTSISPGTFTCSNATVATTTFTGTPEQPGTSMYLATNVGFETLTSGIASLPIALTSGIATTVPIWLYANDNTTTGTFNFNITRVADTVSSLASMVITNCSNFNFSSAVTSYPGIILNSPFTTFSFTPVTTSVNSTMKYSYNGSSLVTILSGVTQNITTSNYLPTQNTLTVVVTPQSGLATTYTFTISRSANAYLSNFRVYLTSASALATTDTTPTVVPINPNPFTSSSLTISSEVGPNVNNVYVVLTKASEGAISMTGATLIGVNTVGDYVYSIPVVVTTPPQPILQYSFNSCVITVNVPAQPLITPVIYNYTVVKQYPISIVSSISLSRGGVAIPLNEPFNSYNYTYTTSTTSGDILVTIVGANVAGNIYYLNGSVYSVPTVVSIGSSTPIIVGVSSANGESSFYQISLL